MGKESLVKNQKVSKYYANDCLQKFILLFMLLSATPVVKNSHNYARIYLIVLKIVLKQTRDSFNIKFRPQWKDRKSSYQQRQILALFYKLIALILGKTAWKALELPKLSKKLSLKGSGRVRSKIIFPETIIHKAFETSFHVKWRTTSKVWFLFLSVFC